MAWQYPEVFGLAACMSSTFAYRNDLIDRVLSEPKRDTKFYLDSGWPGDNYEVTLAMAMALLAALGTIIPQWHMLQGDDMAKAQVYIQKFGESKYHLINALGLNRIYFTGYFFLLMLWLAVSAIASTVVSKSTRRFSGISLLAIM